MAAKFRHFDRSSQVSFLILALLTGSHLIHEVWNYRGIYRWLVEYQIAHQGSYYASYSVVISFFIHLAVMVLAALVIYRFWTLPRTQAPVNVTDVQELERKLSATTAGLRQKKYRLVFLLVGLILLGSSGKKALSAFFAGQLLPVNSTEIEKGEVPESNWLRIAGRSLTREAVALSDSANSRSYTYYIPLVGDSWHTSDKVHIIVVVKNRSLPETEQAFEGIRSWDDLPGSVRSEFEKSGLGLSERLLILNYGESPGEMYFMAAFFALIGGIVLLGNAFAWWKAGRFKEPGKR